MAAEACPSIRCTTLGFAPDAIASEAAVCLNACAVTRGNVLSAVWHRCTAPAIHDLFVGGARYPPPGG